MDVVNPSSERSLPTMLVPPETRRMMGLVFSVMAPSTQLAEILKIVVLAMVFGT
jgi:hypothetical protein